MCASRGKNSADIRIVVDALDLCYWVCPYGFFGVLYSSSLCNGFQTVS